MNKAKIILLLLWLAAAPTGFAQGVAVPNLARTPARGSNDTCSWKTLPVVCGPRGLPAGTNILYRNDGKGSFIDVSEASGIAKVKGRYVFTSLVSDYDNDGWPDIYLACDSTPNILFHNEGNGTFTDIGLLSGTAVNEDGQEQAGMGVAAGDYDHDGLIDMVKTNFADDTPTLYHNDGKNLFTDVTYPARLGVNTRFLGWGAGFLDFDNDGWKDIFSGIGARVTMTAGGIRQVDEVRSGGSILSQNDLRLHFGLGKAVLIERAEVVWPSGRKESFANLKANRVIVLEEGKGRVVVDNAARPKTKNKAK
ncbi:MAG: CRTAC1 family protein [Blastocatellia bacterium]